MTSTRLSTTYAHIAYKCVTSINYIYSRLDSRFPRGNRLAQEDGPKLARSYPRLIPTNILRCGILVSDSA
jgi:hypothetical protein